MSIVENSAHFTTLQLAAGRHQGYGRAAVSAIKRHAFKVLLAHHLWLDVKSHNARAQAAYEKEGFDTTDLQNAKALLDELEG